MNGQKRLWRVGLAMLIVSLSILEMAQVEGAPEWSLVVFMVTGLFGAILFIVAPME